jgi:hypothetical protein
MVVENGTADRLSGIDWNVTVQARQAPKVPKPRSGVSWQRSRGFAVVTEAHLKYFEGQFAPTNYPTHLGEQPIAAQALLVL